MNDSLKLLLAGNAKYAKNPESTHGPRHPQAAILTCTDERVVPQHIFSQPPGYLYMVRMAGNVCTPEVTGSLELAVSRLGTPLIIVMGHTDCTAVAMAHSPEWAEGNSYDISRRIRLATATSGPEAKTLTLVEANVRYVVNELRERSTVLSTREREGKLTIAGAIFDLESGKIRLL